MSDTEPARRTVSDTEPARRTVRTEPPERDPRPVRLAQWSADLFRDSDDGIFVADEDGVVLEVNDAWARIVGYGRDGAPYRPPHPWWPESGDSAESHAQLDAALARLRGGGSGSYEVRFRHRTGRRLWVSITATSVPDPGSARQLLVGTARDVTQERAVRRRQQLAVTLSQRLNDAAEADEVLRLLTHDLAEMFDAEVRLTVHDAEPATDPRTGDGTAPHDAVRPATASTGPVPGVPASIRAGRREWRLWIAFAEARPVTGEEHLVLGLASTAAAQALQRLHTRDEQRRLTDRLRSAAASAAEQARAWQREAATQTEQTRAERRFRSLVEATNTVVWSRDPDGMISEPQDSLARYTGQPWPAHRGAGWLDMVHPDDRPGLATALPTAAGAEPPGEVGFRLWHAGSGTYRHVLGRAAAIRDQRGDLVEWLGTITDVHAQVAAEQDVRRTTAIIDAILREAPVGIGWADLDLRLRHINPALARINGRSVADHLGRRPAELWEEAGPRIEELMRRAIEHGPVTGVEFTAPEPGTGLVRHRVASYFPIRIPGSAQDVGVGFTIVDVTERTRLLQALGEQRTRFERLVDTDVLAVFGGIDEAITEANDAFLTMLGHTRDDLNRGRLRWPDLTPPGWEDADRRSLEELSGTGRSRAFPKEYLHADGHRVPVLIGVVALDQAPLRWLAYAADLTAERAAQAESRLFQALVERSGDLIAVARLDGSVRYVNPAGLRMTGHTDAPGRLTDLIGEPLGTRAADRPSSVQRTIRALPTGRTGVPAEVDLQAFTVAGDTEATPHLAIVARDVTDRQRTLRQAEALARLAGALSAATDRTAVTDAVGRLLPPVVEAASATWAAVPDPATDAGAGTGTTFTVPVVPNSATPDGSVLLRWHRPTEIDDRLRSVLRTVADLIGQALQRTDLIAAASGMATLAARLSVTRTPDETIAVVLATLPAVLGVAEADLLVLEPADRLRRYTTGGPHAAAPTSSDLPPDDARATVTALRSGHRTVRYTTGPEIATTVALPLHDSQGRTVAALGLGWRHRRHFGADDLARLDTVADLCEQTLERTRLVAAEHQLIMRLATRLHPASASVPPELDIAVRYRPALSGLGLGGDWYDLISLPGRRFAVVVGDVVGHHIDAAADMAQLRTVINTLIRLEVPLADLFARFTALVGRDFWGTAVVAVVDPERERADVVRAGHPYPILLGADLAPAAVATTRTPPLGLVTRPVPVTSVPFAPGTALLAYTDGLVERRDAGYDEEVRDLHATLAATSPDASAEGIAEAVLTASRPGEDDQALVVVRHRPRTGRGEADGVRTSFTAGMIGGLRHTTRAEAERAGLSPDRAEDFTIAVYELLTNAVRHGGGRGELRLRRTTTTLTCEVRDDGTTGGSVSPADTPPAPDSPGGRGLWLARRLADELHLHPIRSGGLMATLLMRLAPAPPDATPHDHQ
ncbi:PAS domain S-box protein [Actinoplanes oblitus]|uniref:PAS domain S-box protein n=1 Tax=Actinoplanes oblitus TaxID=3040509 RepID=A0ABY8W5I6_9ACTN|nr:PAS domain S-box protein [Actinoplanes oblitus]WIM92948.1 PAS domain S-box protein [Actinoplanes oblitus]